MVQTQRACEVCGGPVREEHQGYRCLECFHLDPCCQGQAGPAVHVPQDLDVIREMRRQAVREHLCEQCSDIPSSEWENLLCQQCTLVAQREKWFNNPQLPSTVPPMK